MKITDAFWEKRNLGVETVEITVEARDSIEELDRQLKACQAEYQVVKVPTLCFEFNAVLTENGFSFVETICELKNLLRNCQMDSITERLKSQISCKKMDEKNFEFLFKELDKGIFETDRISIDPMFSIAIANNRYKGWIMDAVSSGANILDTCYKNKSIGFFLYKKNNEKYEGLLGGVYKEYSRSGFGAAIYSKWWEYIKADGGREIHTKVSTNNLSSLKADINTGFEIMDFEYVFVKHI